MSLSDFKDPESTMTSASVHMYNTPRPLGSANQVRIWEVDYQYPIKPLILLYIQSAFVAHTGCTKTEGAASTFLKMKKLWSSC